MTESAQTMQRIVNDVLDFAKPMQLNIAAGDVREVIRRAGESCRTKAEAMGVAVTLHLPAEPIILASDGFQVQRALVNLIDNAIEASPRGGTVTVTAAADRESLEVRIRDHGSGMDRETLAHLFEPFYTTKSGGTGLGMPIARKVFTEHGGNLRIVSDQGKGTEAIVRLPLSASPAQAEGH